MKNEKLHQYKIPFKEKNIGRDEAVVGSPFHRWGYEGLRSRNGFEGGENLQAADDLSGEETGRVG